MLVLYALREVWQSFRTHRSRTLSMGFGVFWVIFVLVLLLGVSNGFRNGILERFKENSVKTMIILGDRNADRDYVIPLEVVSRLPELFSSIQHISSISCYDSHVQYVDKKCPSLVLGCDSCYALLANVAVHEGRFFTPHDEIAVHNVCVIGITIKEKLFGSVSPIGQYIFLGDIGLQVVGVLDPVGARLYSDSDSILLTNSFFKKIFPKRSHYANAIQLTLVPNAREEVVEAQFRSYFARHLDFDIKDTKGLALFSIAKHANKFDQFFKSIFIFNTIIGVCLLLIGIVGMSNMMLITIQERRQEIAIRRVLGSRSIEIVAIVLSEVVMVTLVAGMIGFVAGFSLIHLLNKLVVPWWKMYYLSTLTCPPLFIFGGLGLVSLTSCLAGMLPAIRAVNINLAEALGSK